MTDAAPSTAAPAIAASTAAQPSSGNVITNILKAADERVVSVGEKAVEAVAGALDNIAEDIGAKPPFSTHSDTLAGELSSRAEGYKKMVADLDAKIALLDAERDDLLKAYQMLSSAMQVKIGTPNG